MRGQPIRPERHTGGSLDVLPVIQTTDSSLPPLPGQLRHHLRYGPVMFIDRVTTARSEIETVDAETRLFSDPPDGLLVAVSWEDGNDQITTVMVWETAAARGEFAFEKMMPLIARGNITGEPEILSPFRVFVRS